MTDFPLPGAATPVVVAPAPGHGPQFWTGAPSAVLDGDNGPDTTDETVIAVSDDGEHYETVLVLPQDHFGAQWTERPALARAEAGWRLWASCATPNTKHWYIAVMEAPTLEALADAEITVAFAGDADTAVKDPIIRRTGDGWAAWICWIRAPPSITGRRAASIIPTSCTTR